MKFAFLMYSNLEQWLNPTQSPAEASTRSIGAEDGCLSNEVDDDYRRVNNCTPNAIINTNIVSVGVSSHQAHQIKLSEPVTFTLEHKQASNLIFLIT